MSGGFNLKLGTSTRPAYHGRGIIKRWCGAPIHEGCFAIQVRHAFHFGPDSGLEYEEATLLADAQYGSMLAGVH